MKMKTTFGFGLLAMLALPFLDTSEINFHAEFNTNESHSVVYAYPPAVGILSGAKNCLSCHVDNGPWKDESKIVIDILDKETKKSLRQTDGTFLIEVSKQKSRTVLTVLGYQKDIEVEKPNRNAWLYIDTSTIAQNTFSKFAEGWEVNLQMACRLIGDELIGYENADITSLPMTIRPLDNAADSEVMLQAMLTSGESIKAKAKEGMIGNYFERKVKLKVID